MNRNKTSKARHRLEDCARLKDPAAQRRCEDRVRARLRREGKTVPARVYKLAIREIDPVSLKGETKPELLSLHLRLHQLFAKNFAGTDKTSIDGLTREDLVNSEIFVQAELKRRDLEHKVNDELTKEARALKTRKASTALIVTVGPPTDHEGIGELAPIHRSGKVLGPPVVIEDVLPHFKSAKLRIGVATLVGGLANHGETTGDIDLLVKGPLSDELRQTIEFRLGRMLPSELSERVQFLDESLGGPFTSHIELADLVLVMRGKFEVKQMRDVAKRLAKVFPVCEDGAEQFAKQRDPLLDLPKKRGPQPCTLQHHFIGKGFHTDLRLKANGFLVGWTLATMKAGTVKQPVDTLAEGRRIARAWDVKGSFFNKQLLAPKGIFAVPKSVQPLVWLRLKDSVFEEGSVGASKFEEGTIIVIDGGPKTNLSVEYGLQKSFSHEYFFTKGNGSLRGILFFRQLTGQRGASAADVEAGRATRAGETFWRTFVSKEFLPSVLRRRAVNTKSMPPDGYSAIPKTLEAITPKEFQYWKAKGAAARKIRDALVVSRFFTARNLKMVAGEFRRVETVKSYMYIQKAADNQVEKFSHEEMSEELYVPQIDAMCSRCGRGMDATSLAKAVGLSSISPKVSQNEQLTDSAQETVDGISSEDDEHLTYKGTSTSGRELSRLLSTESSRHNNSGENSDQTNMSTIKTGIGKTTDCLTWNSLQSPSTEQSIVQKDSLIDGKLLSAPDVKSRISNGRANDPLSEASALRNVENNGGWNSDALWSVLSAESYSKLCDPCRQSFVQKLAEIEYGLSKDEKRVRVKDAEKSSSPSDLENSNFVLRFAALRAEHPESRGRVNKQAVPKLTNDRAKLRDAIKDNPGERCGQCQYFTKPDVCSAVEGPVAKDLVCDWIQSRDVKGAPRYKLSKDDWLAFGHGMIEKQPYSHIVRDTAETPAGQLVMIEDTAKPKPHRFSLSREFHIGHTSLEHHWTQEEVDELVRVGRKTMTKRLAERIVEKQLKTVDFALSWQTFKGQTVIRAAPSRQIWHLMLDRPKGLETWILQRDPLGEEQVITGVRKVRAQDDLLKFEGTVEPGQRIGGDVLNETKATPSEIQILDSGKAELLEDARAFKKIRFRGKELKGIWTLVAEEIDSPLWQLSKGVEPGRAIPMEKKLSARQQADLDQETERIRENAKKSEADQPHRFKRAQWTHKNGHPRCLSCGHEETMSGVCNAPYRLEQSVSSEFHKLHRGGDLEVWDRDLRSARAEVLTREAWREFQVLALPTSSERKVAKAGRILKLAASEVQALPSLLDPVAERGGFSLAKDNPFLKKGEQRTALGIVLEPEEFDTDGEIVSAKEIRLAAKNFGGNLGLMHEGILGEGSAVLLGHYIARKTFVIDGEPVKKGTWLALIHVTGKKLWAKIRDREYRALSIGGTLIRDPI